MLWDQIISFWSFLSLYFNIISCFRMFPFLFNRRVRSIFFLPSFSQTDFSLWRVSFHFLYNRRGRSIRFLPSFSPTDFTLWRDLVVSDDDMNLLFLLERNQSDPKFEILLQNWLMHVHLYLPIKL